jgi:hypothetical protein
MRSHAFLELLTPAGRFAAFDAGVVLNLRQNQHAAFGQRYRD